MATADETTMNDSTEVTNDNVENNTNMQLNLESDSLTEVINPENVSSQNNCVPKKPEGEDILSQNKLVTNNDLETQNAISQNLSETDKGTILESCSENDVLNNAMAKEKCVTENLTKSSPENNSIINVSDASLITNEVTNSSSNPAEETTEASVICVKKEITENSKANENTVDEPEEVGILHIHNFYEKPFSSDMYKYFKSNTTDEIYDNIDALLIRNQNGNKGADMAVVMFKSKEIALKAKCMLEILSLQKDKKQPFGGPITLQDKTSKRPAPETNDESVPQKRMKPSKGTFTMPSKNKSKILYITHLPTTWLLSDIENYIKGNVESSVAEGILYIHMDRVKNRTYNTTTFNGCCHVVFDDVHKCKLALDTLRQHNKNNNTRIVFKYEFPHSKFAIQWIHNNKHFKLIQAKRSQNCDKKAVHAIKITESVHNINRNMARNSPNSQLWHNEQKNEVRPIWNHKQNNIWNHEGSIQSNSSFFSENDKETYGLSLEFLKSKDIEPPLTAKVCVDYLPIHYKSEAQLRKMFQHAGRVTNITTTLRDDTDTVTATLYYDHPLEAVQAVLMFDGQKIGNKNKIKVKMDQSPDLLAFGPGLGPDGEIIKNVRSTFQLKQHSDKIMNKLESMEKSIDSLRQNVESLRQSIQDKDQTELPSALRALLNSQAAPLLQLLQQQNTSNPLQQPQTSASAQAQAASWNNNQPNNAQTMSSGYRPINQGTTNMLPVPNAQMGYMQDNSQASVQNQANMGTVNMQGGYTNADFNLMLFQDMANLVAWQIAQGSNMAFGQYGQGIQNASNTSYIQGDSNFSANVPPQYAQGAQNVPTQFAQTAQNVPPQFAQGAQNVPPQNGQATHNLPSEFSQEAQNVPSQFSQGAQNMPQQFVQAAQNVPPQIVQGAHYAQMLQNVPPQLPQEGAQNMPQQIAQGVQNMPQQIAQGAQNVTSKIAQGAQNVPQQITQGAQNMPQQIAQGAQNVPSKIAHGAQNVYPEFAQGVKNAQVSQNVPTGQGSKRSNASPQNRQNDLGLFGKRQNDKNRPSPSALKSKSEKKNESRDKYTVRFSRLPPSVTRQSLKTKMSELGELRDVEMLGPGRARVTFYSSRDAADCIKLLDHTKVDGQTIEVKYD